MNKKEDVDFLIKLENEYKTIDFDHIFKKIKNSKIWKIFLINKCVCPKKEIFLFKINKNF